MLFNKKSMALGVALMLAGHGALAQEIVRPAYDFPAARAAGGVRLADSPFYVIPSASVAFGNDSNVTRASTNEIDSAYFGYSAGIRAEARDGNSVFQLGLLASGARYDDSSADDFDDYLFDASYDIAFDPRNTLRVNWDYLRGHEARGTTDRGPAVAPDEYFDSRPGVTYVFGAPGARGRMELYGTWGTRRYLNNPQTASNSNRDTRDYGAILYVRAMPKTHFLVEARGTDFDYVNPDSTLSGSETRIYGGVTWEATAATTGTIKIGQLEKRYDSVRPSTKDTGWEGKVTWLPRTYSKVDVFSARQTTESTGLGDSILTDTTGIVWSHAWNSVLTTEANATFVKDKYKGFDRTDDTTGFGIRANYRFRPWMTLGAEYQNITRDSNERTYEYDRDVWFVTAQVSM